MRIILIFTLISFLSFCSVNRFNNEFDFSNKLAKEGLWEEAAYRWEKLVKKGDGTAVIYNNLAIAMEHMGRLDQAKSYYKKALELDSKNDLIVENQDRLLQLLGEKEKTKEKKK